MAKKRDPKKRVALTLDPPEYQKLKALADECGLSVTTYVAWILAIHTGITYRKHGGQGEAL